MKRPDVIVVGGGVIGAAVAFALSRGAASVMVVERDRIGAHASRASAGMLAPISESLGEGKGYSLGLQALDQFPALVEEARELSGIDPGLTLGGILSLAEPDEVVPLRAAAERLGRGCEWLEPEELRRREFKFGNCVSWPE